MQKRKFSTGKILAAAGLLLLLFLALLFFYTAARLNTGRADGRLHRMTEEEQAVFFAPARAAWEKQRFGDLRRIPLLMEKGGNCADQAADPLDPANIRARSALILDAATGTVIFEKNAGEEIPPWCSTHRSTAARVNSETNSALISDRLQSVSSLISAMRVFPAFAVRCLQFRDRKRIAVFLNQGNQVFCMQPDGRRVVVGMHADARRRFQKRRVKKYVHAPF